MKKIKKKIMKKITAITKDSKDKNNYKGSKDM